MMHYITMLLLKVSNFVPQFLIRNIICIMSIDRNYGDLHQICSDLKQNMTFKSLTGYIIKLFFIGSVFCSYIKKHKKLKKIYGNYFYGIFHSVDGGERPIQQ